MEFSSIFCFFPCNFLWRSTNYLALKNIAKQHNIKFSSCFYKSGYREQLNDLVVQEEPTLCFFEYNPDYNIKDYENTKSKFPNSKIVMFGGDVIYYGRPAGIPWPLDLLIDTMQEICNDRDKVAFPIEHYYWSVSETIIEQIENTQFDNIKEKVLISLCRDASSERTAFFSNLKENGYPVTWNLNLWQAEQIYKEYNKHKFSLGHTTPVWTGRNRSMKGYRDWISPFTNTVLIYDDYPDILDIGKYIVPIYRYLDYKDCINLINAIDEDSKLYNEILLRQKEWARNNTLEKQIDKIVQKHFKLKAS